MANPQKEDGYVRIANDILDNLAKLFLNSREWNVVIFVIRKTYGYNKKFDDIALSQFERGCRLTHSQVCKILPALVSQRILLKSEFGYALNKNYDEWVVSQGRRRGGGSLTADIGVVSQQTIRVVSQQRPTIDNITKDNLQKTVGEFSSPTPAELSRMFFDMVKNQSSSYQEFLGNLSQRKNLNAEKVRAEVDKFAAYWTERTKDGKRQRWEKQETFEVEKRLTTWFGNVQRFNPARPGNSGPTVIRK